ncbi:PTP 3 [Bracoviriform demolitoris]|uniref:Probable tyrosine phosphatase protein J2 n=2 Tax=root TaxID=1 RepID=PTPJ2_MDBVW|nr:PTP 3 [Bracoviriform demolitoris]Q5I139.1 RecName: Full=Probable tyrosine phosphatase protein J2; Short=PTP-J2 [Microplitis demolitor bracovirus (isolate Webb)]AAW51793.1 PTP 3 [Bracoviriform demolitoris]KAG6558337.1 protein tyrosine phosphatase J2 [Microplitis demolitor]
MPIEDKRMRIMDFINFVRKPDSLSCIIQEYRAIVPEQEDGASKSCNQAVNRAQDENNALPIVRLVHSRVNLFSKEKVMSARYVDGYNHKQKFIITINSCENNTDKYLQMLWDNNVQIVVTTSSHAEKNNFNRFWSLNERTVITYNNFQIETLEIITKPHFVLTLLVLTDQKGQARKLSHFQYTAWPADGFSHDPKAFLDFFFNIDSLYADLRKHKTIGNVGPITIDCIDNNSSSEVFCVLDICLTEVKKTGMLSIANAVKKVRQKKYGCMNRLNDYVFCYHLIHAYLSMTFDIVKVR